MGTCFMAAKIAFERIVGQLIQKIEPKHFDEIYPYINQSYY